MNVGDLCKVVSHVSHTTDQYGDLVMVTKASLRPGPITGVPLGHKCLYVEAINLKTLEFHHYKKSEVQVISECR